MFEMTQENLVKEHYNSKIHHRRSIRLNGYDYSQCGAYFITMCTQNRECLFGKIIDDKMHLSNAGKMMQKWWLELSNKFPHIELDEYIFMPNHFHSIVLISKTLQTCKGQTPIRYLAVKKKNNIPVFFYRRF
jgi:REP element-mobilizing transposase RayT